MTTMTREKMEKKVVEIIGDYVGIAYEEVKSTSSLVEDLGADSLDIVEIIMALEEEFDIDCIDDSEVEKFKTVADVCNFIATKKKIEGVPA